MSRDKFYITTSIAYTNAKPHIGYCLELLQADVLARYNRQQGREVLFLTGTDEHGSKIANKAKEQGKEPQVFVDEISQQFQALKSLLNLSNNDFIRTSDQIRHWPTVRKVWQRLEKNKDIYKKKYKGLYCVGCEAFVTEKELVGGKCPLHQKAPEVVEEENYFFRLSRYQKKLKTILEKNKIKITPQSKKNEILGLIEEGLEDVSCSREKSKLSWGVPVPNDSTQMIYVWFEALINYLSALGYLTKNERKFQTYWPPAVHCIGKDIVRFHALLWPAMLLGLGLKLPQNILIHGYLMVGGEKMSKTLGNVIDPFELVEKYGSANTSAMSSVPNGSPQVHKIGSQEAAVDAVRYFLLREISPTEDGDFTYERFEERYNADLANGIGNLAARVLTLAAKFNLKSKILNLKSTSKNPNLNKGIQETQEKTETLLAGFKFNEALASVWELIGFCDKTINEVKPWENKAGDREVVSDLLYALSQIADLLRPFLPQTSERIKEQLKAGRSIPLFPRV